MALAQCALAAGAVGRADGPRCRVLPAVAADVNVATLHQTTRVPATPSRTRAPATTQLALQGLHATPARRLQRRIRTARMRQAAAGRQNRTAPHDPSRTLPQAGQPQEMSVREQPAGRQLRRGRPLRTATPPVERQQKGVQEGARPYPRAAALAPGRQRVLPVAGAAVRGVPGASAPRRAVGPQGGRHAREQLVREVRAPAAPLPPPARPPLRPRAAAPGPRHRPPAQL